MDRALSGTTTLGAMAMKKYSAFPKIPIRLFNVIYPEYWLEGAYPAAKMQSVYSTATADWARHSFVHFVPDVEFITIQLK